MPRGRKPKNIAGTPLLDTPPLPPLGKEFNIEELNLPVLPFPYPDISQTADNLNKVLTSPPKYQHAKEDDDIGDIEPEELEKLSKEDEAFLKEGEDFKETDYLPEIDQIEDGKVKKLPKTKIVLTKKPETEKWWTTIYYGPRGSGKTLHQAKIVLQILEYLSSLYKKNPHLKKAIVFSIQRFNSEVEEKYGEYLYYWSNAKDLRYCPRKKCWKTAKRHKLHGCYLIFDDIATILPADGWTTTPIWLRKLFAQARHFGIRIVANLQDPFSCDINFRRYVDMAFRFRKLIGSKDPDETRPPIKYIWGIYQRRRIKAEWLWKFGDMSDDQIAEMRAKIKIKAEITGDKALYQDIWKGSFHIINRKICSIYDTTQDVPEYVPTAYEHTEIACIDPSHPNCGYKKVFHKLV